jgi:hypothetical protein
MNRYPSAPRNSRLKAEGIAKRQRLLSLMPTEFTASQLAHVACMTQDAAHAQVQKMVRYNEIVPTSEYKKPRVYRKVTK